MLGGRLSLPDRLRRLRSERKYAEGIEHYNDQVKAGTTDAKTHLWGGQILKDCGRLIEARCAFESALDLDPDGSTLGTARFARAGILQRLAEPQAAIESFTEWLAEIDRYPELELPLFGLALYNRGLAYRCARLYEDSLRDYTEACAVFRRNNQKNYLPLALHNRAWVACLLGDEADAQEALDEARPLCMDTESCWQQLLGEAFLLSITSGSASMVMENQQHALALCHQIIEHGDVDGPSITARSQANWLSGRLSLRRRDWETADRFVHQALLLGAGSRADTRCLYDAADLFRELCLSRSTR